ncbi:tripartite tricarboxylate transporter permease [Oceanicola sp. D3]|uniref:tripartite tricarboxylate transporter permease n=1 Tax=Oceanicola sp. D3 TaxID=2587163 RepID=UPI0011211B0C|nr:tripartite tricarboxylate transporter permease [Oceanicola sp. D3]QDC08616.1 tripartite tricarboxylate transporter permease [Oceanicola sp. D3]
MFDAFLAGLQLVFTWPSPLYLMIGVAAGIWLGAVPGLGGITGVVIILPFTFGMDTVPALALILGVFAVTATSDTIASVMLGIPGTAASQATVMDGYPMAQRGEAARAFGAAFTASAIGGVMGGLAMAASLPVIRPLILSFGTPEFFMLGALGLTMVATISGASIGKGLAAAAAGLMLSQIGFPVASEEPRYWFEIMYLIDGLPLIPLVLGLFALPEMLDLAVRNTSISRVERDDTVTLSTGIRDALQNWWLVIRCSWIGIYIGMLPGLGGMIADWVAYGHAVQSSRGKDGGEVDPPFGRGQVRGVIAPESANNAVLGGALIPTVGLGIPGSASMAILLGAFTILGLAPGRAMLGDQLDVTFSLVWMLIFANIVGAGLLMLLSRQVARLAFVDGQLIVPLVLMFVFMSAWLDTPDIASWVTVLALGAIGYMMKRGGWPRPALVLGFVLGPVMENAFVLSSQTFSLADLATRPLTMILLALLVLAVLLSVRTMVKARRTSAARADDLPDSQTGHTLSIALGLICLCAFAAAIVPTFDWPRSARLFPLAIAPLGVVFAVLALMTDGRALMRPGRGPLHWPDRRSLLFLALLACMIATAVLLGQPAALLGFTALYLLT